MRAAPHPTGRRLNHDPLSRGYAARRATKPGLSVVHSLNAPPLRQENNGCTGFATGGFLNCGMALDARKRYNNRLMQGMSGRRTRFLDNDDGNFLYSKGTEVDDFPWTFPPSDEGGSGVGVARALKALGVIDRYEWTFSFTDFLGAIQKQPVLIGTVWADPMFYPNASGVLSVPSDLTSVEAGHEYLGRGILWSYRLIRIRNSWGADWGNNGDAYIRFADMERLLAAQGDVVVPIISKPTIL